MGPGEGDLDLNSPSLLKSFGESPPKGRGVVVVGGGVRLKSQKENSRLFRVLPK